MRAAGQGAEAPPSHVLVLASLSAARRPSGLRGRRRSTPSPPAPDPMPVPIGRATVIDVASPLEAPQAEQWLSDAGEDLLHQHLAVLNRMLLSYRIATADPHQGTVGRGQALVARIGFGDGEQVADGQWSRARELLVAPPRRRRRRVLVPEARLAALLTGRDQSLVCEELTLRARHDLESGHDRQAALQLLVALDAALAELPPDATGASLEDRLGELREQRGAVAEVAQAALEGPLAEQQQELVAFVVGRLEAVLRARTAAKA